MSQTNPINNNSNLEQDDLNLFNFLFTKSADSKCPIRGSLGFIRKPSGLFLLSVFALVLFLRYAPL